ncbi:MAG: YfcE family phosphodiesterase [Anaerolineaceae bacterium]|nr:YfcE family phosphodiesterase [Anaerolineaceae bacterium]
MSPTIAILSDTHDNLSNLNKALEFLRAQSIDTIVHCGDLTSAETAWHFHGFRVIHAIGNGDQPYGEIQKTLLEMNANNFSGSVFEGEIEGVRLAVTHGHAPRTLTALTSSGKFRYIFHGHTHRRRQETIGGSTVINPGALGGLKRESRSFALLDLSTDSLAFQEIL